MRNLGLSLASLLLLSVAACGDDDDNVTPDGMVIPDATPADAPRPDAKTGDGNDSFADAKDLEVAGTNGYSAGIEKPGDRDYYKITLAAGDWIEVIVDSSTNYSSDLNPTIIMYKEDTTTEVTTEDTGAPALFSYPDPFIRFRAKDAGTYYFVVGDAYDMLNAGTTRGDSTFEYDIMGYKVPTTPTDGVNIITSDAGDDAASAVTLTQYTSTQTGSKISWVYADYKAGSDLDVFKVNVPAPTAGEDKFLQIVVNTNGNLPNGVDNSGSTICTGKVWVTTLADTSTKLAEIDGCKFMVNGSTDFDNTWLWMSAEPGDYLIFAERPATGGGDNDFYSFTVSTGKDDPREAEAPGASDNDDPANAEELALTTGSTGAGFAWFVSRLSPADTDVDWYKATAPAGLDSMQLICWASSLGSGLTGFKFDVYSDAGTTLVGSKTEPAPITPPFLDAAATPGTTYHIKLTAASQSSTVAGDYAHCVVIFYLGD